MSTIRRQSIISSGIVYLGFALGLLNTYLFTREGGFTKAQYGLTGTFIAFANIMFSVASLGMPAFIGKFFPYYNAHVEQRKNDQLTWALLISLFGFSDRDHLRYSFQGPAGRPDLQQFARAFAILLLDLSIWFWLYTFLHAGSLCLAAPQGRTQ